MITLWTVYTMKLFICTYITHCRKLRIDETLVNIHEPPLFAYVFGATMKLHWRNTTKCVHYDKVFAIFKAIITLNSSWTKACLVLLAINLDNILAMRKLTCHFDLKAMMIPKDVGLIRFKLHFHGGFYMYSRILIANDSVMLLTMWLRVMKCR